MNVDQASLAANLLVPRSNAINADDPTQRQFVGIIIQYIGSQASCLLTTASNNTIASAVGAVGATAADANFTVGATPGTIDLTNAAANTMGELVDFINNLSDYKARLVGCLRADDADTTAALVAVSGVEAKTSTGYGFAIDSSVADQVSFEISAYDGLIYSGTSKKVPRKDSDYGRQAINSLVRIAGTLAYTGADLFRVWEVDDFNGTETLIYQQLVSVVIAASTSAGTTTFPGTGITGRPGCRLIVRVSAATTMAVTNYNFQATTKLLV